MFATLKHMTGHGQPESGTNVGPANISERILREVFFPPFRAAVERGNAQAVMPSYNEIDGVPSHVNRWLLQDVLRGEMGFKGAVVSDYFAIKELIEVHHTTTDPAAARPSVRSRRASISICRMASLMPCCRAPWRKDRSRRPRSTRQCAACCG